MKTLTNFDKLYNKFIFQWSQNEDLSDIISNLKNNNKEDNNKNLIQKNTDEFDTSLSNNNADNSEFQQQQFEQEQEQQNNDLNIQQQDKKQKIKQIFYQIFPSFLIHKCQNKFPLEDDSIVPTEIIDNFWNLYSQIIIQKLINTAIQKLSQLLLDILYQIFGPETTYNDNIFNQSAMKLVQLNIN